jgi:hypothetical protein
MSESSKLAKPIFFFEGIGYAVENRKLATASECFHKSRYNS